MIDADLDELHRRKRWHEDAQMRARIGFDWRRRARFEPGRADRVNRGLRCRVVSDGAIVEIVDIKRIRGALASGP
jgi:hypothetical protein